MRSYMRRYWRRPDYWRWWWQERVSGQAKGAIAVIAAVACGVAGILSAQRLTAEQELTVLRTERVVTVSGTDGTARVVTQLETVTRPADAKVTTVRRDGRTVIVPAETVTTRGPVEQRTDTLVQTRAVDRVVTVTTRRGTETVTTEMAGPERTETDTVTATDTDTVTETVRTRDEVTVTNEVTVTDEVTITEEETVTEEVTVTVTVTDKGKP